VSQPQLPQDPRQPPPAWYPDPGDGRVLRWWDGTAWTPHTQPLPDLQPPAGPPPGTAPPAAGPGKRTAPAVHDGYAIASLVLSLVWLGGVGSLLGIIFGALSEHEAKRQMRRTSGLAIAGQVIGVLGVLAVVGYILIWRQAASPSP